MEWLDGALGTELEAIGVDTSGPEWSARAVREAPERIVSLHAAYAAAGARVHTACTFRTTAAACGDGWEDRLQRAVALARRGAGEGTPLGEGGRVAGSLAPAADCWRPDLAPADPRPAHRATAWALARAGVDLILCETFASPREGLIAAEIAAETGLPVWLSFTSGPADDLADPRAIARAARSAGSAGAERVLVNCVPARRVERHLDGLAASGLPWGVYANGGLGPSALAPAAYADLAAGWVAAGATAIGGCCGTGPAHVACLRGRLDPRRADGKPPGPG